MELFLITTFVASFFFGIMAVMYSFSVSDLLRYLEKTHAEKWRSFGSPTPFSWYGPAKAMRVLKFIFAQDNLGDPTLAQKSKRAKMLFIVFVVSVLLFVFSFTLLLFLSTPAQQIPSPELNEQTDPSILAPNEVKELQTYRNEEFGFEINYPPKEMFLYDDISIINFYWDSRYKGIKFGELRFGCTPYIYPNIDDNFLSLLEKIEEETPYGVPPYPLSKIIKSDTGEIYFVGFSIASRAVDLRECRPVFNQILSTFRFVNENQTNSGQRMYCEQDSDCGATYCESPLICCVPTCINNMCTEECY